MPNKKNTMYAMSAGVLFHQGGRILMWIFRGISFHEPSQLAALTKKT